MVLVFWPSVSATCTDQGESNSPTVDKDEATKSFLHTQYIVQTVWLTA